MTRSHTGNCADKRRVYDCDCRSDSHDIVQLDDVAGTHSDAAITRRRSDSPFLWRTVDVNVSRKRVRILCFKSTQPQDPRHDRIATRRIGQNDFASAPPVFEYRARWSIVTDFLRNLQLSEWRSLAAWAIAETKLGRRDRICGHERPTVQ